MNFLPTVPKPKTPARLIPKRVISPGSGTGSPRITAENSAERVLLKLVKSPISACVIRILFESENGPEIPVNVTSDDPENSTGPNGRCCVYRRTSNTEFHV